LGAEQRLEGKEKTMEKNGQLPATALYRRCDPTQFEFETTADLEELTAIVGQPRATEAMQFGMGIERKGYNLFAMGPVGTGKQEFVRQFFEQRAKKDPVPSDWCYVYNFEEAHKPNAIRLPAGKAVEFRGDMEQLVEDLRGALSAAFESEEYQTRRQVIGEEFQERQAEALEELQQRVREDGLALVRTPAGFVFAPARDGEVLSPEEMQELSQEERERLQEKAQEYQEELQGVLRQVPSWQRERRDKINELDREVAGYAVAGLIQELVDRYAEVPEIIDHLEAVREDLVQNARELLPSDEQSQSSLFQALTGAAGQGARDGRGALRRYQVNVLVDHSGSEGAPVIYEDNPTYQNLVGRVEHMAQMGALLTDFSLIKAGTLHQANGGYLILDARKVLTQPYAWDGLKRALQSNQIRIESVGQMLSLVSTISLEPEAIPLDVKVALFGEQLLYYMLWQLDSDFRDLFKVAADFAPDMERSEENQALYAQLIATLARQDDLRPFDRSAVARVIEQSARTMGDADKLSAQVRSLGDLLQEADYWAGQAGQSTVRAADVQRAIDAQIYRSDRLRERSQEAILRETLLIDTEGETVGQVNGLSVLSLGNFWFGRPTRITAQVRLGKGEVIDIEREVKLGGPIHSKGVLILSGFLGARYAEESPLSLSASLVFEQSYGGVEGDSASSAELYALLSAIAELPIKQSLAVTGSVNQLGQVQAIGGVNAKIEGFFDICQARGLTGEQGVLIPAANVKHLMLRQDVVEAAENGQFHVYAVETIDQGIELLTGVPAGEQDEEGNFPEDSVNGRVKKRLAELAKKRQDFAEAASSQGGEA
jgi:lon-related putative ATP-dependent protease